MEKKQCLNFCYFFTFKAILSPNSIANSNENTNEVPKLITTFNDKFQSKQKTINI